ncbi:MAG: LarC family nickel insertion protein [Burkholderiales bacterium]
MSSRSSPDLPAAASLALHLDLVGGLAGDMFVAALVDALPALEPHVMAAVQAVAPAGAALPAFAAATQGGLAARRFGSATPYRHASAHAGTSHADLVARITAAPLAADVRAHALAILSLLAHAEAQVHGIAVDAVHFHEIGDWDSLQDVVAAGAIAARLAGARWSASAVPLGHGQVKTAHGMLPVPAPATAVLLAGYAVHDDGIGGERVTPTGAAILRHLVPPAACGGPRTAGRLRATGHGAGTRTLAGVPNVVRALVLDIAHAADDDAVAVLAFDVDDMTGEELALAAERLRDVPGVRDVSLGTRQGKKGRPLTDFRLLVAPGAADAALQACFRETSTLGVRVREERRRVLRRDEVAVGTPPLAVKRAQRPGGEVTAKAAHDDVAGGGTLAERRATRTTAERSALDGEAS